MNRDEERETGPAKSAFDSASDMIVDGFAIAQRSIDPGLRADLAARLLEHIRAQTASSTLPAAYQFRMPNGGLLTVFDQVIGNRRRLSFKVPEGMVRHFSTLTARAWPRRVKDDGPWFSWPMSPRKTRRLTRDLEYAVQSAFINCSTERRPRAVLIDLLDDPMKTIENE